MIGDVSVAWLIGLPGIVATETPQIAFGVTANIQPPTVLLVFWRHDDFRACRYCLSVMLVNVSDDDVRTL